MALGEIKNGTGLNEYGIYQKVLADLSDKCVVASGPNYIRFADGTQICFGAAFNGLIPEVVTYPVAFIAAPFTTAVRHWSGPTGAADTEVWIYDTNNTGFKIGSNNGIYAHWIAAGRWK